MSQNNLEKKFRKELSTLLQSAYVKDGETDYSHQAMPGGLNAGGKFNFNDKKKRKALNKFIAKSYDKGIYFTILERLLDWGPLKVDLDMHSPFNEEDEKYDNNRLYDDELLFRVIEMYRDSIREICDIQNDNELVCMVFEKEHSVFNEAKEEIKDGIHLIFPHLCLYKKTRHIITENVIKKTEDEDIFGHLSNGEVIDTGIISSHPWMIYGCCKPNKEPYILTRYLDADNDELDLEESFPTTYDIIKKISLRDSKKWREVNGTKLKEGLDDNAISEMYSEIGAKTNVENLNYNMPTESELELIEKASRFTEMFSTKRATGYESWLRVGWALKNTSHELLNTWIKFSKKCKEKFKEGECEKKWNEMKQGEGLLTIRSLAHWAKEDNPDEYRKYNIPYYTTILKNNSDNTTYNIANALYHKYQHKYVCSCTRNNEWHVFKNHRWEPSGEEELIKLMSEDFKNDYIKLANDSMEEAKNANANMYKVLSDQAATYKKIADKLMDIRFKKTLIQEAKGFFSDKKFSEKLNENYNLIGFTNGVYDLKEKKFRAGQPDDHITFSTGVPYQKFNERNPYMKYINDFFTKVFPNENVRKFVIERLSSCVSGHNTDHQIYFCLGEGSNGKSILFKLMKAALGDYYVTCPISLLTKKRGASNAASPELARLKGPRCGVYQEPGPDEKLNVGILKELTGNDTIAVRGLFKDMVEITPQAKQFIAMNELFNIDNPDGGTRRRICLINFVSLFKDKEEIENMKKTGRDISNVYLVDPKLPNKLEQWASTFASYLVHIYINSYGSDNKMAIPEDVKMSTNQYLNDQDTIREFFNLFVKVSDDKSDKITKTDLQNKFKDWFLNSHNGETMPKAKKLYEFVEKEHRIKYSNRYGYSNLKFIDYDNDTEGEHSDKEEDDDVDNSATETSI